MTFDEFDLAPEFKRVLDTVGFTQPTPIQEQCIPHVLAGADLIGCAQTGSGKTAAYVLPILTLLADFLAEGPPPRGPSALVLVPTRELACQVVDMAIEFARALDLSAEAIYGGVSMNRQIDALRAGVDLIVATPGRLLDHTASGRINWNNLEFLVLDEADRMLDIGFLPDIRRIIRHLPQERQTLLYSATMPRSVSTLAHSITKNPEHVTIGDAGGERPSMPEGISHAVYVVHPQKKMSLLQGLLEEDGADSVLVFTRTKVGADNLCRAIGNQGIAASCIHGDLDQKLRLKALAQFGKGEFQVLVATDVAARGIDVTGISHVINYDFPPGPDDYIHRVGRTGRADATGDAISFVTPAEWDTLLTIEQALGKDIPRLERNGITFSISKGGGQRIGRARRRAAPRRW